MKDIYTACSHGARIHRVYSYGIYTRRVQSRGWVLSPGLFLFGIVIRHVQSRGRGFAGYNPIRNKNTVCSHGGEFSHQDCSFMEDIYTVCSHGGKDSPGIFLGNIYMSCVVKRVSFFTRIIPLRTIHTPAMCSHEGQDSPGKFPCGI